jgi:arylsulfatase A-like enzyme
VNKLPRIRFLWFPSKGLTPLLALFLAFVSCSKNPQNDNLVLITLDTQRADYISAYDTSKANTPHIDSLADMGTLFKNCYSLIPITLPSHASLFFSQPPHRIKNYNNGQVILNKKKRPPLASLFKKNGYQTAAFISLGVLKSQFGLAEDFDVYRDEFPENRWYKAAGEVNREVFEWLDGNKDQKFFAWIHYSDPHDPYCPPDMPNDFTIYVNDRPVGEYNLAKYEKKEVELDLQPGENLVRFDIVNDSFRNQDQFLARLDMLNFNLEEDDKDLDIDLYWGWFVRNGNSVFFFKKNALITLTNHGGPRTIKLTFRGKPMYPIEKTRELYRNEVEYMDSEIGKLFARLEELDLFNKTHIIIVGDHGEGLGEYRNYLGDAHVGHIHFLKDVYMRVPLIIYNPHAARKKTEVDDFVSLLDLAPTIMQMMNFKNTPSYQGRNLLQLKKKDSFAIFEETYKPEAARERFAILQYPWHLIIVPEIQKYELYNLADDPEEQNNIFQDRGQLKEVIDLKKRLDEFARDILNSKEEVKIDKETEEMLKALGYIK